MKWTTIKTSKQAFLHGFRRTLPFQGGVVPFGALFATLAVAAGLKWWLILALSICVFGGSSQLVFIDLYRLLGSPFQAVVGSNILNARHLIYSAGVTREFARFSTKWKLLLAYLLTDQLFAISVTYRDEVREYPAEFQPWFYFGSGFCTWIIWVVSTAAGIAFGNLIPENWNLPFAIPLMFMPIFFSVSKSKYGYLAGALAAVCVFFFQDFPYGLGVLGAIVVGSVGGYFIHRSASAGWSREGK